MMARKDVYTHVIPLFLNRALTEGAPISKHIDFGGEAHPSANLRFLCIINV